MNTITMIPIEQLLHHPENPRKDLGDLTELAESIKANGVMQNLTVVQGRYRSREEFLDDCKAEGVNKCDAEGMYNAEDCRVYDGHYSVVIGNRRMEAAKIAGLTELPCVISDMDHKTQVATMLMENMQRQDLTVYEQAQGFQMMMDLGFTAKEIGDKTGFSEKTVKDRIKLTKFNQKNFEKAVQQGATLMDMIEISKLESKSDQNEAMKEAGTNNFRQKLIYLLSEQTYRKNCEKLGKMAEAEGLKAVPEDADTWNEYDGLGTPTGTWESEEKILKAIRNHIKSYAGTQIFYKFGKEWSGDNARLQLYKLKAKSKEDMTKEELEKKEQDKARQKKVRTVKKLWAQAYQLRADFIRNYTVNNGTGMTTIAKLIAKYALRQQNCWNHMLPDNQHWKEKYIKQVLDLNQEDYEEKKSIWELVEAKGIPMIRATVAWINGGGVFDGDNPEYGLYHYYDGRYEHDANGMIRERYEFLQEIGYQMSDMEKQLMDGTHECYKA